MCILTYSQHALYVRGNKTSMVSRALYVDIPHPTISRMRVHKLTIFFMHAGLHNNVLGLAQTAKAAVELVSRQYVDVLTTHNMHDHILTISIILVGGFITHLALCKVYVDIPTIRYKHFHILTVGMYAGLRNNTFGFPHTASSDRTRLQTICRYTQNAQHACPHTRNIHHT